MMAKDHYCSFCGKHQDFVNVLVAGPNSYICDVCIKVSQQVVDDFLSMKSEYDTVRPD